MSNQVSIAEKIRTARTFLFVPGDRPERFDKAAAAGADVVIVDLEDAVSPADKPAAREHIADWFGAGNSALIRINAAQTPWHDDDVALAQQLQASVVLAKATDVDAVAAVGAATSASVIALIETARGIGNAGALAELDAVVRLGFGAIDFAVDIGVDPNDREALLFARSGLVLASAAAGIAAPIDGVTTALREPDVLVDDVRYAARIGMPGKLCIHPAQVAAVHDCLAPTDDQIAWARSILEAAGLGSAAVAVDGHMVDPPVVARAERILASVSR
ncbi:CoA ester lyase [Gordonia sp. VNQ95]|uniref:HpcH/HpaI aldolase/citrate lyase family protein n=1 Tax=Gordonia sp. VNQ95 TaxID=3156619 RepID=UPI0032B4D555